MDFKKLSKFIIVCGIVIFVAGGGMWFMNRSVGVQRVSDAGNPFGQFMENTGRELGAMDENMGREGKRATAVKVMIGGIVVIFAGIAVSASAKKSGSVS